MKHVLQAWHLVGKVGHLVVEALQVVGPDDLSAKHGVDVFDIDHHPRKRVDRSFGDDFQDKVMPMIVRRGPLAEKTPVFLR